MSPCSARAMFDWKPPAAFSAGMLADVIPRPWNGFPVSWFYLFSLPIARHDCTIKSCSCEHVFA